MAPSPWGWYFPIVSPTIRADFLNGRFGERLSSDMEYRTRRCTGFKPSRTSGSARETMTEKE
ncbi:MAG: hypothetical protein UZ07_CHB004000648 [Chlorobi bacterium OLB7]|nr:MAG: hypothetical protein UZ07_CHB004000648 [Chlorobi bacterium OLB7]